MNHPPRDQRQYRGNAYAYPRVWNVWNGWVYFWNGREWVPQYPYKPEKPRESGVTDEDGAADAAAAAAAAGGVNEAARARRARQTQRERIVKIQGHLRDQGYSGDSDVITAVILAKAAAWDDSKGQEGNEITGKQKRKRLGKCVLGNIVSECIEEEKRLKGGTLAIGAAKASPPMPSTTRAALPVETNAVTSDDKDDAARPESESEIDPHAGLISPRGVDADVTATGGHNKSDVKDSKMPADQVVSSVNVSASSTSDNNNDEDEEHNDDAAAAPPPAPVSLPPPSFDAEHLQIIGEGIQQRKVVQADVGNVGKTDASGSLLYLPPKSWSTDHDMHPLKDAKIVLRTRFKGISNEVVGGEKRIRSLGKVDCSSDLYDTLILSTEDDKGTSVALWKSVEEGRSWFISWLAVNVKCERKGYPTYLLRCIRDLAKGFGVDHIYLEVGKSSTIRDGGEWEGVKTFYRKLGFSEAGGDVPDDIKACCQELGFGTHEVLKWDLNKRKLRARR